MSSKRKRKNQQGSSNRSSAPGLPWVRRMAMRKKSAHPKAHPKGISRQSVVAQRKQSSNNTTTTGSRMPIPPAKIAINNRKLPHVPPATHALPSPPAGLAGFERANCVHQRQLELNLSDSSRVYNQLRTAKDNYMATMTNPPTTTAAFRAHILSKVQGLWEKYDELLSVRRNILEKQQHWLEQAIQVDDIRNSVSLLTTINMQIEAARDLSACQKRAGLYLELPSTAI